MIFSKNISYELIFTLKKNIYNKIGGQLIYFFQFSI